MHSLILARIFFWEATGFGTKLCSIYKKLFRWFALWGGGGYFILDMSSQVFRPVMHTIFCPSPPWGHSTAPPNCCALTRLTNQGQLGRNIASNPSIWCPTVVSRPEIYPTGAKNTVWTSSWLPWDLTHSFLEIMRRFGLLYPILCFTQASSKEQKSNYVTRWKSKFILSCDNKLSVSELWDVSSNPVKHWYSQNQTTPHGTRIRIFRGEKQIEQKKRSDQWSPGTSLPIVNTPLQVRFFLVFPVETLRLKKSLSPRKNEGQSNTQHYLLNSNGLEWLYIIFFLTFLVSFRVGCSMVLETSCDASRSQWKNSPVLGQTLQLECNNLPFFPGYKEPCRPKAHPSWPRIPLPGCLLLQSLPEHYASWLSQRPPKISLKPHKSPGRRTSIFAECWLLSQLLFNCFLPSKGLRLFFPPKLPKPKSTKDLHTFTCLFGVLGKANNMYFFDSVGTLFHLNLLFLLGDCFAKYVQVVNNDRCLLTNTTHWKLSLMTFMNSASPFLMFFFSVCYFFRSKCLPCGILRVSKYGKGTIIVEIHISWS